MNDGPDVIAAPFRSYCPSCGGDIRAGEEVSELFVSERQWRWMVCGLCTREAVEAGWTAVCPDCDSARSKP